MLKAVTGKKPALVFTTVIRAPIALQAALPKKLAGPVVRFWRHCDTLPAEPLEEAARGDGAPTTHARAQGRR
jgi:hypothetical protein